MAGVSLTRSQNMARIRAKNTKPELLLRKALWAAGLRYRKHAKTPVGRPDIVFLGPRVAVFIDGCFWHGCPHHYVRPRSKTEFWSAKLEENVRRDVRQTLELESLGWNVCRFWEHEVFEELPTVVQRVSDAVETGRTNHVPEWRVFEVEPIDEAGDFERRHQLRLRYPETTQFVEQKRHTRKWRRP